jgi:hypothetical protein
MLIPASSNISSQNPGHAEEQEDGQAQKKSRPNAGDRLIEFLIPLVRPLRTSDGQHYAVMANRPNLALPHTAHRSEVLDAVCAEWYRQMQSYPSSTARAQASAYLSNECRQAQVRDVEFRVQHFDGAVYLDVNAENQCILRIDGADCVLVNDAPVLFRRNDVTRALPQFGASGDLRDLLKFVRIPERALPALLSCLVTSWLTHLPQPLVLIQGTAAAGKTTSMRFLLDLVDPTTKMPGATLTDDERTIRALSQLRRTFIFDNVSNVKNETSDVLAKITTGSELVQRALYENSTPDVIELRRPVFINGILEGFARSDLSSRSVVFELSSIPNGERRSHPELESQWENLKGGIFSALARLVSVVLREWESTDTSGVSNRSPDLVRITRIISKELSLDGLPYLAESAEILTSGVLGSTPLGAAMTEIARCIKENPDGCNHRQNIVYTPDPHPLLGVARDFASMQALMNAHVTDHARLPQNPNFFSRSLKGIERDLAEGLNLAIDKGRTKSGQKWTLRDAS